MMIRNKIIGINILLLGITILFISLSFVSRPTVKSFELRHGTLENAEAFNQQFRIIFSRPMNQDSVTKNISIEPAIDGNFSWVQNTLFFTPKSTLNYGQIYKIHIGDMAMDKYGKSLARYFDSKIVTKPYQYIFINNKNQLMLGSLSGDQTELTSEQKVVEYHYSKGSSAIVYLAEGNKPNDTEPYLIENIKAPKPKRILDGYKNIQNLAFSADGESLYFMAEVLTRKKIDEQAGTITMSNQGFFVYSISKETTQEISLPDALAYFIQYWLTPDGSAFIFNDGSAYYLKSVNENSQALLGSFGDYGGASLIADKLVFTKNWNADFDSGIILYDGQSRIINQVGEVGAVPTINDDGSLVSYSFVSWIYLTKPDLARYDVRVIDTTTGDAIFTTSEQGADFMESSFSPDSKYLTLEEHEKTDNGEDYIDDYIIYPSKNTPNYLNDKITTIFYDLSTKSRLEKIVDGYDLQWVY